MLRFPAILFSFLMLGGSHPSSFARSHAVETSSPQVFEVPAFTVIGLSVRTTNAVEMSGENGKIGPLWNWLLHGDGEAIPGAIEPGIIYAVYTGYESDETGAYDLVLGKSVRPKQQIPAAMRELSIPAAGYLVFPVTGRSPEIIQTAWGDVYRYFAQNPSRHRAFTYDFEQYSGTGTRIFIAIR